MGLFAQKSASSLLRGVPFEYDWRLDGERATFCVDLSLFELSPQEREGYPVLAYVGCLPLEEGRALSPREKKAGTAFIRQCKKKLSLLTAGYIETDSTLQLYLYLPAAEEYEALKQLAANEKGFTCRVGGRSEPQWESYFSVLYPDEAKLQTVRNGEIINELYKNGDSEEPRRLNLHMGFQTDEKRSAFSDAALKAGFALGESVERAEGMVEPTAAASESESDQTPFRLDIHRICALKKWDVDAVIVQAVRLAEEFGGRLVYWDCPIVPRRS